MRTYNFTVNDQPYTVLAENFSKALLQLKQQLGLA
jgi:hypothetical protein